MNLNRYRRKRGGYAVDANYDDDADLAPVMPAIDAVQQLIEEEQKMKNRIKAHNSRDREPKISDVSQEPIPGTSKQSFSRNTVSKAIRSSSSSESDSRHHKNLTNNHPNNCSPSVTPRSNKNSVRDKEENRFNPQGSHVVSGEIVKVENSEINTTTETLEDDQSFLVRNNPLNNFPIPFVEHQRQDEYEFIPKSVILDVYSNDPEVKRFLKQLPRLPHESGLNEQDYKCYSCRRPIGLVFGPPRLCHFDGNHYCSECHLDEKSVIPSRILCNWDFNKYPVSKRNQHFLTLISNESIFELKKVAPLLYKMCPNLREIEELRRRAFFVRLYCTTCAHDSISFELTKLIWPREHLMKQTDIYSLEDLVQIKNGTLKQVMQNVITFGRQHVLSCVLCCQKGFICEICKSSRIIYPFDTDTVYRCNECQSTYHKSCFKTKPDDNSCPRCQRLKARRQEG